MIPQQPRRIPADVILTWSSLFLLSLVVAAGVFFPGCREQSTAPIDRNLPPETVLVDVPGDSTTAFYRVHLYWTGIDPDGEVTGYEWAITDSLPNPEQIVYGRTSRTDSTFVFSVAEDREIKGHRFYVRAIDNQGKRDPEPAWTFFAVRNNSVPIAWYTRAEGVESDGTVKPIREPRLPIHLRYPEDTLAARSAVRFSWRGSDADQALTTDGSVEIVGRVAGYTYHLSPRELNYLGGDISDTTVTYPPEVLDSNLYTMYVRPRDDAGLSALDPEVRTFVWNYDPKTYFTREADAQPARVFYASTTGPNGTYDLRQDGDTIPLTQQGVRAKAWVMGIDPDPPHQVMDFQARLIKDSGFWNSLSVDSISGEGRFVHPVGEHSGDYLLMARAMDWWNRWDGTPDTIRFYVNFPARFRPTWEDGQQRPMEGDVLPATLVGGVYADTLLLRFGAVDPDGDIDVTPGLWFNFHFATYPTPGGFPGVESFDGPVYFVNFEPTPSGVWTMNDYARLQLPGARFIPGDYTLVIRVRERPPEGSSEYVYGARDVSRTVHFRLQ